MYFIGIKTLYLHKKEVYIKTILIFFNFGYAIISQSLSAGFMDKIRCVAKDMKNRRL